VVRLEGAGRSYRAGAISIKTLITPEWWMLAPLPVAFLLLAIEFIFRMHRLSRAGTAPRPMRCRRHDGPYIMSRMSRP
jgi:hypothetical protein